MLLTGGIAFLLRDAPREHEVAQAVAYLYA